MSNKKLGSIILYILFALISTEAMAWAQNITDSRSPQKAIASPDTQDDIEAAHSKARHRRSKGLQESDVLIDGARGYHFDEIPPQEITRASFEFRAYTDEILFRRICTADEIVVASNVRSRSAKTNDSTSIYTAYHFETVTAVKKPSTLSSGADLKVLRSGGEVTENGQKYRTVNLTNVPYREKAVYLLFLKRDKINKNRFFPLGDTVEIRNGRILMSGRGTRELTNGSSLRSTLSKIDALMSTHTCSED